MPLAETELASQPDRQHDKIAPKPKAPTLECLINVPVRVLITEKCLPIWALFGTIRLIKIKNKK